MHGSFTTTASQTNTYTDARLRAIMPEIGADFYNMACAGLLTFDDAQRWTDELAFILQNQTAHGFQIQLTYPNGQQVALDYRVSSDGSIHESNTAGGIDYYALPTGTRPFLFVNFNYAAPKASTVIAYLGGRGWSFDAHAVQGDVVRDRAYSKDGYGVIRGKIGNWP
jgi:hypothetical protein